MLIWHYHVCHIVTSAYFTSNVFRRVLNKTKLVLLYYMNWLSPFSVSFVQLRESWPRIPGSSTAHSDRWSHLVSTNLNVDQLKCTVLLSGYKSGHLLFLIPCSKMTMMNLRWHVTSWQILSCRVRWQNQLCCTDSFRTWNRFLGEIGFLQSRLFRVKN